MLPSAINQDVANIDPDILEPYLLSLPQAECPVIHHFGPGVYIREVTIPQGAIAMGHKQRHEHLNIVLKGSVAMIGDDGQVKVISAPAIFVGKPGRKVGGCIEECTWHNVYPNPDNCRDIEELEARWFDKTDIAKEYERLYVDAMNKLHDEDRADFEAMLIEIGVTAEQVREESEIESDMVDLPPEYACRVSVRNSPIEGRGLFLCSPANAGELIAPGRIGDCRTIAGRYVNHAKHPNCEYRAEIDGNVNLYALADINGALGGSAGCELTVNYRDAVKASGRLEYVK
jgi:hypothetical protein